MAKKKPWRIVKGTGSLTVGPNFSGAQRKGQAILRDINDCVEREVAFIQSYNAALTKDETQKQYLILQPVSNHRIECPFPTKADISLKF